MECPICINKTTEKNSVKCPACDNIACKKCYKTYIMNSGKDTVNCMHCNIIFNRSSILKIFGKSFLTKTLLDYQKEVRFKIFQSRFPEVLPHIENIKQLERLRLQVKNIENSIETLTQAYAQKRNELNNVVYDPTKKEGIDYKISKNKQLLSVGNINIDKMTKKYFIEKNKLHTEYDTAYRRLNQVKTAVNYYNSFKRYYDEDDEDNNVRKTESKKKYIQPCFTIDCKGFLNEKFYCGICNETYCSDCYELLRDEEHICNPEIKDNIKLLKKDTKQCPKCNTGIHKIDGCDQMYCTNCHTAFSWTSGNIVKGAIHNPHYFEYLRRTRERMPTMEEIENEFNNLACNDNIDAHRITLTLLSRIAQHTDRVDEYFSYNYLEVYTNMMRIPLHFDHVIEVNNQTIERLNDNDKDNMIQYLLDKTNRAQFDINTSKDKKKIEFTQEFLDIVTTCRDIIIDNIRETYNNAMGLLDEFDASKKYDSKLMKECIYKCINEIKHILEYSQEAYTNLLAVYQFKARMSFTHLYSTAFLNIDNVTE